MASELSLARQLAEDILLRPTGKERALRALADIEDLFEVLADLCEHPDIRELVAQFFPVLEAGMAALAVAAGCVPPEPEEEVGP